VLDIKVNVPPGDIARIPPRGPLLIAANHPHGALDGLAVASALAQVRTDTRILANHLLSRIPELRESCFFVDPFARPDAAAQSLAGLRAAHLWVRNGGALVVFPSGEVAHRRRPDGFYDDSPWRSTAFRLARATGAQVVPAFVGGANSPLFYACGLVHPALRTALLARELLKKRGTAIVVRFGARIAADRGMEVVRDVVERLRDEEARDREVRMKADTTCSFVGSGFRRTKAKSGFSRTETIAREIAALPGGSCLVESSAYQVFCAEADRIPSTLREIGRLREIAYRAVGEGTGKAFDLDAFDQRYLHLFAWDRSRRAIVGAYRVGLTDRIVAWEGVEGLYTRTLFRYDARLIARLSPALELGRSFVSIEYQRNYNALLLLWKGIGQFVVRHPEYRVLFGPVSISSRYSDRSHSLLIAFLRQNHLTHDLAKLVEAINPANTNAAPVAIPQSVDEADRLVARLESDRKGLPVLLRQYLKLDARLIGFNVDPNFGDALDALMMVDLPTVDRSILVRYLGRAETDRYLARHQRLAA
jgi:putative hemolysin